ncbi:MAG TPA: hypothetical protein VE866_17980, partial [Candidatus Binatia bacterium]|nr:hypothetical protein [Candidatus Binatia bacterium]
MERSRENVVAIARAKSAYDACDDHDSAPEIGGATNFAEIALHQLFRAWRLDSDNYGSPAWNPLASLIPPGSSVLLKPNWVFHQNQRGPNL